MRELILVLLQDEHGISWDAWTKLTVLAEQSDEDCQDILDRAKEFDGRVFLI